MTVIFAMMVMVMCGWYSSQSLAAAIIPEELDDSSNPVDIDNSPTTFTQILINRLQTALTAFGIYNGPVNGIMDADTKNAVLQYQRTTGQPTTGIIDEALVSRLETTVNVNQLMDTLSTARQAHTEEARNALLANPATRDLIVEGMPMEPANPVRDPSACFANPTVRCLLDEALESAKAIPRNDMRNWAFGDILVAQARAGLSDAARDTIRRISDPRMVMVALGQIAEAQARAGQALGAVAAADIIPDVPTRLEAYANIARIMSETGLKQGVSEAVKRLRQHADDLEMDAKLIAHLAQASIALFRSGEKEDAVSLLNETESAANSIENNDNRDTALRHVADTYADIGRVDHAITILNTIENSSERQPVLMSAARARALEGDPDAALEMAASIELVRYRALVLASIAEGQASTGDLDAAIATLETATEEMKTIELPFARDYATSRIALAYASIASDSEQPNASMFFQAGSLASLIEDKKTHAYTVWNILFLKRESNFGVLVDDRVQAFTITGEIPSASGQAWLLAELAENRTAGGHGELAWDMFDHALKITESIKNSWGRARALSRIAQSLVRLVETGATREPAE